MKTLTVRLKEAENRAESAEKQVKRLQKEVDRLEGMCTRFIGSNTRLADNCQMPVCGAHTPFWMLYDLYPNYGLCENGFFAPISLPLSFRCSVELGASFTFELSFLRARSRFIERTWAEPGATYRDQHDRKCGEPPAWPNLAR